MVGRTGRRAGGGGDFVVLLSVLLMHVEVLTAVFVHQSSQETAFRGVLVIHLGPSGASLLANGRTTVLEMAHAFSHLLRHVPLPAGDGNRAGVVLSTRGPLRRSRPASGLAGGGGGGAVDLR